ncbi:MAG TPA: hypothetical protein VIC71_07895 [Gammaproteobacteria bacterium]
MTRDETSRKEGRIARHLRLAQEITREPRSIFPRARGWLIALWQKKGGGFYGLGYVVAFIALEIATLTSNVGASSSVTGFITAQAVQYLLRISVESIINTVLALLWPVYLLRWLGWYGFAVLAVAYVVFEHALRPLVENWFPELKAAQLERARLKHEKRRRKREKRAKRREHD